VKKLKPEHYTKYLYIIFDVETMLLVPNTKGEREHIVNLVCLTHRCNECKDKNSDATCMDCGDTENGRIRDFSFKTMKEFIVHVLKERPSFEKTLVLSHNGSRYDMILAAKALLVDQGFGKELKIIAQGQKIIEMALGSKKIIFRDTFLYVGVKLAKLKL